MKTKLNGSPLTKLSDLKIGLKYICVPENLTDKERNGSFEIMTYRDQLPKRESDLEYTKYKEVMEKFVRNKEIYLV